MVTATNIVGEATYTENAVEFEAFYYDFFN